MKFFIDTNVLIDWLIPTNSFHTEATEFIKLCLLNKFDSYVSSHSLTDLFYITRKNFSKDDRRQFLQLIVSRIKIIVEPNEIFSLALDDENFLDLEDGLQIKCAESEKLDYIVTENLKDFQNSKVKAVSINEALEILEGRI